MIPVIFINCKGEPFVDDIMNGRKTYETRTRNTLKSLLSWALGERVLIAETGHGAPVVKCSAVIDHFGAVYTGDRWDELRKVHCVPCGSLYDWKDDTKVKWLYHLTDVRPVVPFTPAGKRHGRTWMEYDGPFQTTDNTSKLETIHDFIETFEDFLDDHEIYVPNDEKEQSPDSASTIYGTDYGDLSDRLEALLTRYGILKEV